MILIYLFLTFEKSLISKYKIIILLTLILWLGCQYGQPIIIYTPATSDTAKDLLGAPTLLPLGQRAILHKDGELFERKFVDKEIYELN